MAVLAKCNRKSPGTGTGRLRRFFFFFFSLTLVAQELSVLAMGDDIPQLEPTLPQQFLMTSPRLPSD